MLEQPCLAQETQELGIGIHVLSRLLAGHLVQLHQKMGNRFLLWRSLSQDRLDHLIACHGETVSLA